MIDQLLSHISENYVPAIVTFFWKVVIAAICLAIGIKIIRMFTDSLKKRFEKFDMEDGLESFLLSAIRVALYIVLVLAIIGQFGISAATVVALLGSSGLTIGLAFQGCLSNFAGGLLILFCRPFVVGDFIHEDTSGNEGTVVKITTIYTTLETYDKKQVVIPNGTLANASLVNVTGQEERTLEVTVGISYGSDLKKAKDLIREIASQDPACMPETEILVFVSELADSSVVLGMRMKVKTEEYWPAKWRILEKIKLTFDEEGVEIPFPQVTVSTIDSTN